MTIQAYPSVDAIGEFRVLRSLYPAESGRSGGGQVNVVTRSGTNKFRGTLFEFVRNEAFNANDYFTNQTASAGLTSEGKAKRRPFRYNNYGWTVGGPIYFLNFGERNPDDSFFKRYNRTFFFFSQEFRRDTRYPTLSSTVPTADLRNGIFPIDVCINRNNQPTENCTSVWSPTNPTGGRLPAGTPIPSNFYSPAALAYLNGIYRKLPLPNSGTFGLLFPALNVFKFRQEILKIDHSFNDKASMYYRFQNDKIPTIDVNALFSSGSGLPGVSTTSTNSPGRTHTFQGTYAISPRFIVQGQYVYSYGAILSENIGLIATRNTNVPITLPYPSQRDRVPTITGNGFSGIQSFGPYDNFSDKHNWSGNVTYIFGNHSMKFGAIYSLYRKNENALAGNNEGAFTAFSATLPTGVTSNATNQNLQRWANFLVGNVVTFTQARFDYTADLRQKNFEWYAQDEWRLRRNLTFYIGVRYSFFGSPWDKNGRLTNFFPQLYDRNTAPQVNGSGNRVAGTGNFFNGMIINTQNVIPTTNGTIAPSPFGKFVTDASKDNFAPRIGIAWDPFGDGKTSVRTGYGIYHEQILNGIFLQIIGTNPPYQETVSISNTRLDQPLPTGQNPTPVASLAAQTLRAVQPDWETPYMQHWSLDVQRQLTRKTIVTVGYYGSKGTNLIGIVDINLIAPGVARNTTCVNAYSQNVPCQPNGYAFRNQGNVAGNPNINQTNTAQQTTDVLILDQIRPFRGYRAINMIQPRFNSNYHSLQVSAQHRFSGASQMNFAYTWSKNLTDNQTDRGSAPQNPYDIRGDYGRAALDRRHIFSLNYVYELPFFDKQKGVVGKLLGGWQASGIFTYNTGLPFTAFTSNYDPAGIGFLGTSASSGRPQTLCNPNEGGQQNQQQWFNTACFAQNPAIVSATGTFVPVPNVPGSASRGEIFGPRTFRIDFTMSKNFKFAERFRLQLRAEAFNILNMTNFRALSTNVTAVNFGQVTTVRDPRTLQFGVKFYW